MVATLSPPETFLAAMTNRRKAFWQGIAIGTAAGFGSFALLSRLVGAGSQVVRLEKSLQIGRPLAEVFDAWFAILPQTSSLIEEFRREGNLSHWKVRVDGKVIEWDSEIEQFIPNQTVGWKSVRGPKHTGRVSFSPVGDDTMVHVVMNYAPPIPLLRPFFPQIGVRLEGFIDQVLRDFKAALEGKGQQRREEPLRATGTQGPLGERGSRATAFRSRADVKAQSQVNPTGPEANPVEFSRPPEAKS